MQTVLSKLQKLQELAVSNGISFSMEYESAGGAHTQSSITTSIDFISTADDIHDRRVFQVTINDEDPELQKRWKIESISKTLNQAIDTKEMFKVMTTTD